MDDFNSFVKTAKELQVTHENQVVKVAGILDRLKKLWQSISNPQYRSSVSHLQDEYQEAQVHLEQMQDLFDSLGDALKSGDIKNYSDILGEIKSHIGKFLDEVREADKKTKQVLQWTLKEMNEPGFIDRVTEALPQNFELDYKKKYNVSLSEFSRYKNIQPSIYMSNAVKGVLKNLAFKEIRDNAESSTVDELKEALSSPAFFSNFERAALQGTVVEFAPLAPSPKKEYATAGQTEILLVTQPFQVPNLRYELQAEIVLRDERVSLDEKKRLSVKETKRVDLVKDVPKVAQAQSQVLPYKRNKLTQLELAEALREGYKLAFGKDPSLESLAGGFSQAILESGFPILLPNNNIGNIKATDAWINSGKPYFVKGTIEFTPDGKKLQEHGTKWRAYPTPAEGAAGYWKLIGDRYKKALDWYAAGDPESAAVALAMKGYYTAPVTKYASGLNMHHKRFLKEIAPKMPGLKSEAAPPPGAKPPLKKWVAEYSPEEKQEILKDTPQEEKPTMVAQVEPLAAPQSEPAGGFNSLMNKLLAASDGALTKMVKRSILSEILPENDVLILVKSSDSYEAKLEYGRVCASYLRRVIGGSAEVCSDGKNVEIQCSASGEIDTLTQAVSQLSYLVAVGMKKKTNKTIKPTIAPGLLSRYAMVKPQDLIVNSRKFGFSRLVK